METTRVAARESVENTLAMSRTLTGRGSLVRVWQAINFLRDLGYPAPASSGGQEHLANVLRLGDRRQGLAILCHKQPVSRPIHG